MKLHLKKETVVDLTTEDLATVAGAGTRTCLALTDECLTGMYPTIPVTGCLPPSHG